MTTAMSCSMRRTARPRSASRRMRATRSAAWSVSRADTGAAPGHDRTPQRAAVEADLALVGGVEPGDAVEERRLPGTVGADHAGHFAGAGQEADVVERLQATEADRHPAHGQDLLLPD